MIACSGENLTIALQKELDEAGFDLFFESPLKSAQIEDQVLKNLERRRARIQANFIMKKIESEMQQKC